MKCGEVLMYLRVYVYVFMYLRVYVFKITCVEKQLAGS